MPVVQIRLFGFKAEGSLTRPWKTPNPFGDLMGQMDKTEVEAEAEEQEQEQVKKTITETETEKERVVETKSSGVKSRKSRKEE